MCRESNHILPWALAEIANLVDGQIAILGSSIRNYNLNSTNCNTLYVIIKGFMHEWGINYTVKASR